MKIIIREENKKRKSIPIPNFIVTSKWALRKLIRHMELEGLSRKELKQMARRLKVIIKDFKGLPLVDIEASDGTIVKIYL